MPSHDISEMRRLHTLVARGLAGQRAVGQTRLAGGMPGVVAAVSSVLWGVSGVSNVPETPPGVLAR